MTEPAFPSVDRDNLAELFEQAPNFIAVLRGPEHRIELANPAFLTLTGRRDIIGRTIAEALPEAAEQGYVAILDKVFESGEAFTAEGARYSTPVRPGGPSETRYVDFVYQPIRSHGVVTGVFVQGVDATERARATEALAAHARQRTAVAQLSAYLANVDDTAELAFAAAEMLGATLGVSRAGYGTIDPITETITIERDWNAPGIKTLAGTLHFRDYGSYIDDLKRGETVVIADAYLDPRTAETADALKAISAQALVNMPITERGGVVALLYLNNDTARTWTEDDLALVREVAQRTRTAVERRRVEHELRVLAQSLEQQVAIRSAELERVWTNSRDLLVLTGSDGVFRAVNPAWTAILGHAPSEVVGHNVLEFVWPDDIEISKARLNKAVTASELSNFENRYRHKDGSMRWISWRTFAEGDVVYAYGRDITSEVVARTELARTQDALRQSQKLEAMGQLTGGVAHDFNNLLTPIIGSLDMLQRRGLGGERERRLIDGALQSADRAKTLVQRLLAFARRQPLQRTAVDIAALVDGMGELVTSTCGPQIKVVTQLAHDLPPALADPNQLEMAILNLSVNARDAMPNGGVLWISAKVDQIAEGHRSNLPPGTYIRLSVADDGAGMDASTLAHAIEPFFSTKGLGKGTGLGLSMVHGLASQLGGALQIDSQPNAGTTVHLWLPPGKRAAGADLPPAPADEVRAPAGAVLLVDDEALVRMSTADMLSELGFQVIEAGSVTDALKIIEDGAPLDFLVTDHLMPGMSGIDLARIAQSRRPGLPTLIISGFAEVEGIPSSQARLTKPFRQADLAASLAALSPAAG